MEINLLYFVGFPIEIHVNTIRMGLLILLFFVLISNIREVQVFQIVNNIRAIQAYFKQTSNPTNHQNSILLRLFCLIV